MFGARKPGMAVQSEVAARPCLLAKRNLKIRSIADVYLGTSMALMFIEPRVASFTELQSFDVSSAAMCAQLSKKRARLTKTSGRAQVSLTKPQALRQWARRERRALLFL